VGAQHSVEPICIGRSWSVLGSYSTGSGFFLERAPTPSADWDGDWMDDAAMHLVPIPKPPYMYGRKLACDGEGSRSRSNAS
jgi:hypothetical protein